ncbi:hypothetical protein GQ457_11G029740 [Hibiscus cannabinus]
MKVLVWNVEGIGCDNEEDSNSIFSAPTTLFQLWFDDNFISFDPVVGKAGGVLVEWNRVYFNNETVYCTSKCFCYRILIGFHTIGVVEEVEVVHGKKIRTSCYCDQKLDIIIHSVQNIEKAVVSMNGQFEKLVAILTSKNVTGSIQDNDSLKGEGIHSESKDIGLHNDVLKEDDLENKSHKEEGLSTTSLKEEANSDMKKSCLSPDLGFYHDYCFPSLQTVGKRKFVVNSEDNIKDDTCGLKKIPSEVINFQFSHHRFPSQLVTLKDFPRTTKVVPKISNTRHLSSKSKDSQHKSVLCSTTLSNSIDALKSEYTTLKKRARTNEVNTMFINIYLYDLHLRQKPMPKKLYLPLSFQRIITEHYGITQQNVTYSCYFNFHSQWINDFMPTDSSIVEQVYVPLNHKEGKHWFLLVVDIVEHRNYVLESLGVNDERKNIAHDLLIKGAMMFRYHDHLGRLFKDVAEFTIDILGLPKQPNSMYVLKYIEAYKKIDWSKTFFTTEEMGVERLKCLARLVTSNHKEADLFKRSVCGDTSIDLKNIR